MEDINEHRTTKHECYTCSKKFPTPSKLKIHMRIHTAEKPYVCQVCKKAFTYSSNLNKHVLIHTEKQFVCYLCKKQFTTKQHLQRHQSMHAREDENSVCLLCEEALTNVPSDLRIPFIERATVKDTSCPYCYNDCNCIVSDVACGCHFIYYY